MLVKKNGLIRWWSIFPILLMALGLGLTANAVLAGTSAAPAGQEKDKERPNVAGNQVYAYGLTTANHLIVFNKTNPSQVFSDTLIVGLQGNESLRGIDFRPASGQLYGVGTTGRLYSIQPLSGIASLVGTGPISPTVTGTSFGVDFNPVPDRLRLTSDADQNLRINPDTGAAIVDGTLAYAAGDPNEAADPNIVASAYISSFVGTTATTLYNIDSALDILVRQSPPNSGTLQTVGNLGVNTSDVVGFDTEPSGNAAYAALSTTAGESGLYTINLSNGQAALVGTVGGGAALRGLALPGNFVPDVGSAAYTRQLAGAGNVSSIDIASISISHTFPGDLGVFLVSPAGTRVKLFDGICGGTDWNAGNTNFRISAGAANEIGSVCPPGNGTYKPEGDLSAFNGQALAGTWRLVVTDYRAEDYGQVMNFDLVSPGAAAQPTNTPLVFPTVIPTQPPVLAPENFTDVAPSDTNFYDGVRFLVGKGAISGYNDAAHCGSAVPCFQPYANVTRGQFSKIIVLGMDIPPLGNPDATGMPDFRDVPETNPFYLFIHSARTFGIVSGYDDATHCGTAVPCFQPFQPIGRGQLAKMVIEATGWDLISPATPSFNDVPTNHTFYPYIETAVCFGVVSGYNDDTFRPFANATRGQVSKMTYLAYTRTSADACSAAAP